MASRFNDADRLHLRRALRLAARATGETAPNPLVGAVIVRRGRVLGEGWHHRAGDPHAEIEAILDAGRRGHALEGATLYVTLEPCSTQGRTPPCTRAIVRAGFARVVVAATDPNPRHAGRGLKLLAQRGVRVDAGLFAEDAARLNAGFNHWIVRREPLVTLKAAFTLDGKIATATGDSKWITNAKARAHSMRMRLSHDAILVGVNTVLADDPALTIRSGRTERCHRRLVLDTKARTPLSAKLLTDAHAALTTVVVGESAPKSRVAALERRATVWRAPDQAGRVDLSWLLRRLGEEGVTSLLVEGGGEVHAGFLAHRLAHRVAFFYGAMVIGGTKARRGIAGDGFQSVEAAPKLRDLRARRFGSDLLLEADLA
ncbi:MAG: bifunctional diaminohydroxyphosphoribosylaminopyrimidine deaminase/5-amino-6-(5-phosphoribosylamino)uracil reductase RibD [Verrucomicrobia bacterium]|nr:MAG: bifunctional diaminohydroxyphosphoribosylaminopyrimidine deaminase/5-amino-6-(5-phosphoribosylamino)uracil reductase RibD [Verrucomicrobiota bacterium]